MEPPPNKKSNETVNPELVPALKKQKQATEMPLLLQLKPPNLLVTVLMKWLLVDKLYVVNKCNLDNSLLTI